LGDRQSLVCVRQFLGAVQPTGCYATGRRSEIEPTGRSESAYNTELTERDFWIPTRTLIDGRASRSDRSEIRSRDGNVKVDGGRRFNGSQFSGAVVAARSSDHITDADTTDVD
jgi:hypothetical protein